MFTSKRQKTFESTSHTFAHGLGRAPDLVQVTAYCIVAEKSFEVGDQVVAGESFGEIEAVKTVSELYAPIDGTILEVNEDLEDSPDNINQDCYGTGWIIKVSHEGDLVSNDLLDHKAYSNLIE
mgnify:CR=1 FL=1